MNCLANFLAQKSITYLLRNTKVLSNKNKLILFDLQEKHLTDAEMKRILRFCNLQSLLDENMAITLPQNDSQTNSGLSQAALQSFRAQLTDKEINQIDVILRKCGFPSCSNFPLESSGLVKELELWLNI